MQSRPQEKIPRRVFGRRLAGFGAAVLSTLGGGRSAWGAPAHPRRSWPRGDIVDLHTHLGQEWGNRPALSAGALVQWMDRNQVSQAVVLPLENPEAWDHPIPTAFVLEETAPYRDRLIPGAVIDPRALDLKLLGERNRMADLLARYVDAGARLFGEHKPGIPMADPRNLELFAAVGEVGLPILFHMDTLRNTDEVGLPGLEEVLRTFPDTVFIGHAQAFWASISGSATAGEFQGYPTSGVSPGGAIVRLMERYPNLYGDLGAGSGANAILRDPEHGRDFLVRFADRLVWSSDYLRPGQEVRQFELYRGLGLPEEVQRKIFRDNARRLVGLI